MTFAKLQDHCRSPHQIAALKLVREAETFPGLASWREQNTRVRFAVMPSFSPRIVWVLQRYDEIAQVRRIVWDHVADVPVQELLPQAAPTVYGADAQLPVAETDELLRTMATIHVPPFLPGSTLGLDGVTFSIEFGDSWRSAGFSWWGHPPKEWESLAACHDRAIRLFDRFLPICTAKVR